jgi:glutamine amidotransferase
MIVIVDYGLGNVRAFESLYRKINLPCSIASSASELDQASKIILPGVGSFDFAMDSLLRSGMREKLDHMVVDLGVPVLGVCVGMQMMSMHSEEGSLPGLGWIDGRVKKFDFSGSSSPADVPHMGWNNIKPINSSGLFEQLDGHSRFYFLHSYYFSCATQDSVIATTDYGGEFASAVEKGNVFGVQFHPEKSHGWGVRILENFARI